MYESVIMQTNIYVQQIYGNASVTAVSLVDEDHFLGRFFNVSLTLPA